MICGTVYTKFEHNRNEIMSTRVEESDRITYNINILYLFFIKSKLDLNNL